MKDVEAWDSLKHMELIVALETALEVQLTFEEPYLLDPPLETPADAEIVASLARAQQRSLGFERELAGANYGTDGSKLSRAGIQTVVCGPGDIAQAHTANEFVEIEQVELATRMYRQLLTDWHA